MLKRIKIRGKLLLLLTTPLLAVLLFASIGVLDRTDTSTERSRDAELAEFADLSADLSATLQIERFQTLLAGRLMLAASELRADEIATDEALARWQTSAATITAELTTSGIAEEVSALSVRMADTLDSDRSQRFLSAGLASELARNSSRLDGVVISLNREATDLELFRALDATAELINIRESLAEIAAVGDSAIADGRTAVGAPALVNLSVAKLAGSYQNLLGVLDAEDAASLEQLLADDLLPRMDGTTRSGGSGFLPIDEIRSAASKGVIAGGVEWVTANETRLTAINEISESVLSGATADSLVAADAASKEADRFLAIAIGVVLFALVMALVIGRSVSRPLTRLTETAQRLSGDELPAMVESMRTAGRTRAVSLTPIRVRGRDEVAQLGKAFSEIQSVTVEVAEEQGNLLRRGISDIFINLARRNQSLLDRQIEFIDQLESREENPDQLENLFRLDHLATRMRRNAESLLVLAGAEPTRRRGRPVELADVVRVAMGEIEDFSRIHLLSIDSATVAGSVAVDLAHLMSELMENATQFSPPDSNVEVVGHRNADGSYQLTLSDRGIGMSAEQISTANETLEQPPIIGLDLSRSLGFTVVSRLSHRLGVGVRLTSSTDGGVTALVTVPAEMIGWNELNDQAPSAPAPAETSPEWSVPPVVPEVPEIPLAVETVIPDGLADLPMRRPAEPEPAAAPADIFDVFSTERPSPEAPDRANDLFADVAGVAEVAGVTDIAEVPPMADPLPPVPQPVATANDFVDAASVNSFDIPPVIEPLAADPTATPRPQRKPVEPARPAAEIGALDTSVTNAGLIRRTPRQVDVPDESKFSPGQQPAAPVAATVQANRSPEEVRQMLSRYRAGLRKGRAPEPGTHQPNR